MTSSGHSPARDDLERTAIVEAAAAALMRTGAQTVKVKRILNETGLSTRALYRHFPTRPHLLLATWQHLLARRQHEIRRAVAQHDDPVDRLVAWVDADILDRWSPPVLRITAVLRDLRADFPDEVQAALLEDLAPLIAVIREGQDAGVFDDGDPTDLAIAISSVLSGLVPWASGPGDQHFAAVARTFVLRAVLSRA